jgi:hypothetical protein
MPESEDKTIKIKLALVAFKQLKGFSIKTHEVHKASCDDGSECRGFHGCGAGLVSRRLFWPGRRPHLSDELH